MMPVPMNAATKKNADRTTVIDPPERAPGGAIALHPTANPL
jgi:hypothetical protein